MYKHYVCYIQIIVIVIHYYYYYYYYYYYFTTYLQHLISAIYLDVSGSDLCCDTFVSLVPKRRTITASSTR